MEKTLLAFLLYLRLERGLSEHTEAAYRRDLEKFMACLIERGEDFESYGEADVEAFLVFLHEQGLQARSRGRALSAVKSLERYMMRVGMRVALPGVNVKGPKLGKGLPYVLSEDEAVALVEGPEGEDIRQIRDRAMLELLYSSGLRVSELVTLEMQALSLEEGMLRVRGKGKKTRLIPVTESALRSIAHYLERARPEFLARAQNKGLSSWPKAMFITSRGKSMTRQGFWKNMKRYAMELGLPENVSPHQLRHSFATHLLDGGADLRSVQSMLGHANLETTEIYTHVSQKGLHDAYDKSHPLSGKSGLDD